MIVAVTFCHDVVLLLLLLLLLPWCCHAALLATDPLSRQTYEEISDVPVRPPAAAIAPQRINFDLQPQTLAVCSFRCRFRFVVGIAERVGVGVVIAVILFVEVGEGGGVVVVVRLGYRYCVQ